MKTWTHNALAEDLAAHLRSISDRMVWTDLQLGQAHSPRPDVFTLPKSYRVGAMAYECKISVSDFRADVTAGKWRSYLTYASGVYFAVPQGLLQVKDLPQGCGLYVRTEEGWRAVKKPTLQRQPEFDSDVWMKLLMDGIKREAVHHDIKPRTLNSWQAEEKIRLAYGSEIAGALHDRANAAANLRHAKQMLEDEARTCESQRVAMMTARTQEVVESRSEVQAIVDELARALGMPQGQSIWTVRGAMHAALTRIREGGEAKHLRSQLDAVKHALKRAEFPIDLGAPGEVDLEQA